MDYKYQKGQIFGKRLKVPRFILNKVYSNALTLREYIEYELDDKIPISCVIEKDRRIIEKFGIEKCKTLDFDIIDNNFHYIDFKIKDLLLSLNPSTKDLNKTLYELIIDQINPEDYSKKMKEAYPDRVFENKSTYNIQESTLVYLYNTGKLTLDKIVLNWDFFKNKNLSNCLARDSKNTFHITDKVLKEFVEQYSSLIDLIVNRGNIYTFIGEISNIPQEEKEKYVKNFTDNILNQDNKRDKRYYKGLTNDEYHEIFKYSSIEEYFTNLNGDSQLTGLSDELKTLPEDYLYNMPFPISNLCNRYLLLFINEYGLKNIVDFDNECGHFFSKNDCEMLRLMYDMYLHYASNEHNSDRTILTRKRKDENGNYVERPYTKDEFYEAMKRMIIYGPTDTSYKAPDYRTITGEFRTRNASLFLSEDAPEDLQKLFYAKSITPEFIAEHPNYIEFLRGKDLSSCFKQRVIHFNDVNSYAEYQNLYKYLEEKTGFDNTMNFLIEYCDILDIVFDLRMLDQYQYEIRFSINDDIDQIQNRIHETLRKFIIEKGLTYPTHIPKDLIEKYPSMFLDKNAPQELQEAFYGRTITSAFLLSNPAYRDYLNGVDLECLFKYMPVGIMSKNYSNSLSISGTIGYGTRNHQINFVNALKQTFSESDALEVMLIYGKYVEQVYETNNLENFLYNPEFTQDGFLDELDKIILQNIIDGNMKYDESIPSHFKNNNPTLFLGADVSQEIKDKFYNREFTLNDFYGNQELFNVFENTNIACAFSENMSWIIPLFAELPNLKIANLNRFKIVVAYSKIQDVNLQKIFRDYVIEHIDKVDLDKLELVSEVLARLSLSNSSEIYAFRKELAIQILESENPMESLTKIEDLFIKNNIPTVGKIYSCFEILHPDFKGFNFLSSTISPVLKKSSTLTRKVIVFSDLIKASFGSNNRSVNVYLRNIAFGGEMYDRIKNGEIIYDQLSDIEKNELLIFSKRLITLYNTSLLAKTNNNSYESSGDVINDILEIAKRISPNGTLDYSLSDRIIKMFCGFSGINTLNQAEGYIRNKVRSADTRNREAASKDMSLNKGDLVKGIGDITYLRNILQNGSVSKEYLGSSAGSDLTPLDTDLSIIIDSYGSVQESIDKTTAKDYGPIWFVLKNNDRYVTTRTIDGEVDTKRDLSKLELFYTGALGADHYGIRTGFASSDIDYIVVKSYDSRIGLEIAMNGFYIPVADNSGKIIFTPKDYDELRRKMSGLSYYDNDKYIFSDNIVTPEVEELASQITANNVETNRKREKINKIIKKSLEEIGLHLKTNIDGDLTPGYVELIDTGSTGRGTNKPGDGDFDFMMRLDKIIISDKTKLNELKSTLIKNLGVGVITIEGDFRLKNVQIDEQTIVDIDISFTEKTDKITYSTDMALQDRLLTIQKNDPERYNYVVANILLAKKVLKEAGVYKPNRGDIPQGGLGGVGIENWILQNGGSFIDAATSFLKASEGRSFSEFQRVYQVWDFGENHLAERRGHYAHDNFVANNMSEVGYKKMCEALNNYLKMNYHQESALR